MTSVWKQLAICAVLLAGAYVAWENRATLVEAWGASFAAQTPEAQAPRAARPEGTPVLAAQATQMEDRRRLMAIGTGFAQRSVTLRAPSGGVITEISIAPGAQFSEGDTLMRLEDADARFAVSLAEARLAQAEGERDRFERLQDSGVAAPARLEQVQTDYQLARIELDRARETLAKRVLRAPFDGITGLAAVEIGDRVTTDDPVGSFDDRSEILVEFDLPEALLGRVSIGLAVSATTPSAEGRRFEGRISAVDSRVSAASRTARVRAAFDNSADLLRPGTSFALDLDLPGPGYPAVPELALQFAEGALHVWRVTDGAAERVEVRLVRRRGGLVIVEGALAPGDQVVVEGTQRLREGRAVHVLNPPTEPRT